MGLLLVVAILLLTLRFLVALWILVGIAISFVGAFIFLPAADVSINFLYFRLLLVLGIVVDDAVVVGRYPPSRRLGSAGGRAAIQGATSVARPVIFAVLTTVVAFAPWAFLARKASFCVTFRLLSPLLWHSHSSRLSLFSQRTFASFLFVRRRQEVLRCNEKLPMVLHRLRLIRTHHFWNEHSRSGTPLVPFS